MSVGERAIIFLLGAGCSYDATVPMSKGMVINLESLLETSHKDTLFPLYNYVKYTIEYGNNLSGKKQVFNIESLLVILHLLFENKKNYLYPFINGYSKDLFEYAGASFEHISELIKLIERELPGWVTLDSYNKASYYSNFEKFQKELNFAIRVFSLNYDLCLEENVSCKVETGFYENNPWDGNRFIQTEDDEETAIYLYKLHGSIDWERKNDQLRKSAQHGIKPDIIFGTDIKLQAIDPYLFYLYEFRRYALESEIIISIGYSFGDNHINDLIRQALSSGSSKKIISVAPVRDKKEEVARIKECLNHGREENILVENKTAKEFLRDILTVEYVGSKLQQMELPF